jgi:hypothetical protein
MREMRVVNPKVQGVREAKWTEMGSFVAIVWTVDGDWITYTHYPHGGWCRWGYADKPTVFIGADEVPPEVVARFSTAVN